MGCISSKKNTRINIINIQKEKDKITLNTLNFIKAAWFSINPLINEQTIIEMETMAFIYMIEGTGQNIIIPFIDD